jgi:hypothetical protein
MLAQRGLCMITYPDRSKCSTSRSALIRAIASSASCTRLRPLKRRANDRGLLEFVPCGLTRLQRMGGAGRNGRLLLSRCYPARSGSADILS